MSNRGRLISSLPRELLESSWCLVCPKGALWRAFPNGTLYTVRAGGPKLWKRSFRADVGFPKRFANFGNQRKKNRGRPAPRRRCHATVSLRCQFGEKVDDRFAFYPTAIVSDGDVVPFRAVRFEPVAAVPIVGIGEGLPGIQSRSRAAVP